MIRIMDLIPRALSSETVAETVAETESGLIERLLFALERTFLGLASVFLVLAVLYGALLLMKLFLHDIPNRKRNGKSKVEKGRKGNPSSEGADVKNPPAPASSAPVAASAPVLPSDEDAKLTAAITAAIAVYLEKEAAQSGALPTGFRVVSYQKRGGAWNRRG